VSLSALGNSPPDLIHQKGVEVRLLCFPCPADESRFFLNRLPEIGLLHEPPNELNVRFKQGELVLQQPGFQPEAFFLAFGNLFQNGIWIS
jgi:hypothetical protein